MAHRRTHVDNSGGVNLGMVITPMLDMSFQLLAFFIMTYHPSALEAHIDGKLLPPAKTLTAGPALDKKDDATSVDEEPDPKMTARVMVRAVAPGQIEGKSGDGQPSKILLQAPGVATPEQITDLDTPLTVALDRLKTKLTALRQAPGGEKMSVTIDADPNLKYGYFILVQDTCKAAKIENIGFAAPIPSGQ